MTINRNVIDYGQRTERTNAERLDYIIDTLDEIAERVTAIEALFHFTTPVTATDSPESVDPPLPFTNMRTINEQQIATFDTTGVLDYLAGTSAQFRAWVGTGTSCASTSMSTRTAAATAPSPSRTPCRRHVTFSLRKRA